MDEDYPEELTTSEAAKLLRVSPATIVTYANQKVLACRYLPSGHRRYRREDVESLLSTTSPREAS